MSIYTRELQESREWRFNESGTSCISTWHVAWSDIGNLPAIGAKYSTWSTSVGWSAIGVPEMWLIDKSITPEGDAGHKIARVVLTFSSESGRIAKRVTDLASSIEESLSARETVYSIDSKERFTVYTQAFPGNPNYPFIPSLSAVDWDTAYRAVNFISAEDSVPQLQRRAVQLEYNVVMYGSAAYIMQCLSMVGRINSTYILSNIFSAKSQLLGNYSSNAQIIDDRKLWLLSSVEMQQINVDKIKYSFSFLGPDPQIHWTGNWQEPHNVTGYNHYPEYDFWNEVMKYMSLVQEPAGSIGGS